MTALSLGVLASGAFAADVSIKGNAIETLDASDNYFLANTPSGSTARPLTAGTLDVLTQTQTTNYLLDANYSYYKYFGPGTADTSLTWGTPASARFIIDHTEQLTKYNAAATWARSDAATTSLAQTGAATGHGSINTYAVDGSIIHDLSRTDFIAWTAHASTVSFTDPTQTPYNDIMTMATWNHTLSQTTTLNNSVGLDWFAQDNLAKSQRLFWTITSGLQSKLSSRLTFNGNVIAYVANSYQTGVAQSTNSSGGFQPLVGAGKSYGVNIGLTYDLLKTTNVSLFAARAIIPTFTGQLQMSDTVGLSLIHRINQLASLSFSTQFAQTKSPSQSGQFTSNGSKSDFFSASANYSYQLTREWRTNLAYTYRQRDDNTGIARSNTILFALARDFTLLGNPTAINVAEKERAKERAQQTVGYVFPNLY